LRHFAGRHGGERQAGDNLAEFKRLDADDVNRRRPDLCAYERACRALMTLVRRVRRVLPARLREWPSARAA
jgi:hypothetical protein